MIKLRWMGTPDELVWFRRHLEEDQNLRLENVSRILPIRTSNRHFRMMGEVCIADPAAGTDGHEQKIEEKNLEIYGLESDEVFVNADNDLIHQVVYNLIDNAVKFVNEGGCISFGFEQKDGKVFVSVKNTGEGIAQQELPRLFDRFYKTDKSRSLDKTGVGLGLYIVQTIVNQHKGDLIVKSVEGEYTEFTFSLPASDAKALKERAKRRSSEEKEK